VTAKQAAREKHGADSHYRKCQRQNLGGNHIISDHRNFNNTAIREIIPGLLLYIHDAQLLGTLSRINSVYIVAERVKCGRSSFSNTFVRNESILRPSLFSPMKRHTMNPMHSVRFCALLSVTSV